MQTNTESELATEPAAIQHILPFTIQLDLKHGEEVIFAVRQSPLTPVAMLWPIALGVLGWGMLNAASLAVDGEPAPMLVQFGILVLTTILGMRWLVRDLLGWFVCWYVLTNQRLVVTRGLLRRRREEASSARIQT
ncbi:MAG: PH domain-containing protein, partial [Ktedonobacterales bacterium]